MTTLRTAIVSLGLLFGASESGGQAAHLDLPTVFIEAGDGTGSFVSRLGALRVRAERGGVSVLQVDRATDRGHVVRLGFEGFDDVEPVGIEPLAGRVHVLQGRDRSTWRRDLPAYAGVAYRDTASGATLEVRTRSGELDFRFESALKETTPLPWHLQGAEYRIVGDGSVELRTSVGSMRITPPVLDRGRSREGVGEWRIEGQSLHIEPSASAPPSTADWATYIGGSVGDTLADVTIGPDDLLTIVGSSNSPDFPTTPGAFDTAFDPAPFAWGDAVALRFDPASQALVWATFVSGNNVLDQFYRVVLRENGDVVVVGASGGTDFPVSEDAFDQTPAGFDPVICQLTSDGSDLVFATFLGGEDSGPDVINTLDVTDAGCVVVAGLSKSKDYPTTDDAFQPEPSDESLSRSDGVVSILSPTLSDLLYSTYLGGGPVNRDEILGLALDDDGSIVVVGRTDSAEFPLTADALDPTYNGDTDAFVARLSADLSTLLFSTYLGTPQFDLATDVKIGPAGVLVVGGETRPPGFPVTHDAFLPDPLFDFFSKAFLTKLSPSGGEILYSTYLGGFGTESAPLQLAVDSAGAVTVIGRTASIGGFPVTPGSFQQENANITPDAYVLRLHPDGHSMLYGSYLGGSDDEFPTQAANDYIGLATDALGNTAVALSTTSDDFPGTEGTYDPDFNGSADGVLAFLTMLPQGVTRFGSSTPDVDGPVVLGVLSMPYPGNGAFGITTTNAPPAAEGWLALASAALATPVDLAGAQLWLDPASVLGIARVSADELGWSQARLGLPDDPALVGIEAHAQSFWPAPAAPGLLASDGLTLTVQPAP